MVWCMAGGGEWYENEAGDQLCVMPYADGGEPCDSSDECQGFCVIEDPDQTEGFCQYDDNPFGCYSSIE